MRRLVSEDVVLRDTARADEADYVRWFTEETAWAETDAPWEPIEADKSAVRADWRVYYAAVKDLPDEVRRLKLEIEWKDRHVGWVSSYPIDENFTWVSHVQEGQTLHRAVGIDICAQDAWGQGVGTRALGAFLDDCFAHGDDVLYTQTWSGNLRMIRCAEKLGFRECDRKVGVRQVNGRAYNGLTFRKARE